MSIKNTSFVLLSEQQIRDLVLPNMNRIQATFVSVFLKHSLGSKKSKSYEFSYSMNVGRNLKIKNEVVISQEFGPHRLYNSAFYKLNDNAKQLPVYKLSIGMLLGIDAVDAISIGIDNELMLIDLDHLSNNTERKQFLLTFWK